MSFFFTLNLAMPLAKTTVLTNVMRGIIKVFS